MSKSTISATLAINEEILRRRAAGLETIALGFGEASIPVHPELVAHLQAAAAEGGYGPVAGLAELREAVASYFERRKLPTIGDQIVTGPGSKPLLYALFAAIGGPVVLPRPSWVSYAAQTALLGLETVSVPALPDHGGVPDPERLEKLAGERQVEGRPLRLVVVTTPDNPTGTVASHEVVEEFCSVAARYGLIVVSDEIYADLVHDSSTEVVSPARFIGDQTIITTGLSKNLAVGGWRIGIARFPATTAMRASQRDVEKIASELWSAPAHPVQLAAAWAFGEPQVLRERIGASRRLHGAIAREVAARFRAAGAQVCEPVAAFYCYPDFTRRGISSAGRRVSSSEDLARLLMSDHGIATLPAAAFGDDDERLALRVATPMLYGTTDSEREQALASSDPASLPWISHSLDRLSSGLAALTEPSVDYRQLAE